MREALFYILSSFWAGAVHAATPGHGKTIAAAYIVGARGRPIDALILGVFVTLSHTSGIVLVGVLASLGSAWLVPQRIEAWLALAMGLLVIGLGAWMLWTQRELLALAMGEPAPARPAATPHRHDRSPRWPAIRARPRPRPRPSSTTMISRRTHHDHGHRPRGSRLAQPWLGHLPLAPAGPGDRYPAEARACCWRSASPAGSCPTRRRWRSCSPRSRAARSCSGVATVVVFSLGFAATLVVVGVVAAKVGQKVLEWLSSIWAIRLQIATTLLILGMGVVLTAWAASRLAALPG